ncbi:glutathione-dependent formaldehyde-activating, GFA [Aspergillus sclerotiicarbonarius CBS 121057]|uniref:Glutathione-dependent formaldehyde-activating, GFA n=1 Tax=Aspergillus sclerotiicarbonarius (strain CBS 121057 / IBT 28362) TaxID=1448318 RepID=A0A319E8F6_ASPSB|nr:glutathione-dependent formaldehyde-activating, GFA [Aspergillus sclerotiicarbonarius CBS 121057]
MSTSYKATCHCRLTTLTFTLPHALTSPTQKIIRCNCSICTRNGYLLVYPLRTDVIFGPDNEKHLSSYRFGNMAKPHRFCARCGTAMFIDFGESERVVERGVVGVNIRAVDGIEDLWDQLTYKDVDGKHKLGPAYQV